MAWKIVQKDVNIGTHTLVSVHINSFLFFWRLANQNIYMQEIELALKQHFVNIAEEGIISYSCCMKYPNTSPNLKMWFIYSLLP